MNLPIYTSRTVNKLLIIEDLTIIQQGVRATLEVGLSRVELNFQPSTTEVEVGLSPDMVLISLVQAAGRDGVNSILELKRRFPHVPVIGYGMDAIPNVIRAYYTAGLHGYCSLESNDLLSCIHTVVEGKTYFHPSLVNAFVSHLQSRRRYPVKASLTLRQYEIARYLVKGMSNALISEKLGVTATTISAVKKAIFKKLGISSIPELRDTIRTFL